MRALPIHAQRRPAAKSAAKLVSIAAKSVLSIGNANSTSFQIDCVVRRLSSAAPTCVAFGAGAVVRKAIVSPATSVPAARLILTFPSVSVIAFATPSAVTGDSVRPPSSDH